MAIPKAVDNKGRISLGMQWAGRNVILEKVDDTEVRIILARVVPEREAWLHENRQAMAMVQEGIQAARERNFADGPDLDAPEAEAEE